MRKSKTKGFLRVTFIMAAIALAVVSITPGNLRAGVDVSFKLSGNYAYLMDKAGDIDEARRGMESLLSDMNEVDGYNTTFDWKEPTWSKALRAELMFRVTRNFGFSLGSGYIFAKNPGSYSMDTMDAEDYGNVYHYEINDYAEFSQTYSLSAIPITLDAYFILPLNKKETFRLFAHVGAGFYFGRLRYNADVYEKINAVETIDGGPFYQAVGTYDIVLFEKTHSNAFGYQGGFGFDVKLTGPVSLGAELFGRHVVFKNWNGGRVSRTEYNIERSYPWTGTEQIQEDFTESAYGDMWTYQVDNSEYVNPYTAMHVWDEEPEGQFTRKVRKSSLNLNTYGVSVSIKIRFSLF